MENNIKHFFTKGSIVSHFAKKEGVVRDRDIAGEKTEQILLPLKTARFSEIITQYNKQNSWR